MALWKVEDCSIGGAHQAVEIVSNRQASDIPLLVPMGNRQAVIARTHCTFELISRDQDVVGNEAVSSDPADNLKTDEGMRLTRQNPVPSFVNHRICGRTSVLGLFAFIHALVDL